MRSKIGIGVALGMLLSIGVAFGEDTAPKADPKPRAKLADTACGTDTKPDLNTADAEAIAKAVPGIGPSKAATLVGARPFKTWDDVGAVKGVGPAVLASAQRCATLGPAPK